MNCLKCGRTIAAGELLCPACSGRGPQPEPDARIHVHAHHKAHEPAEAESSAVTTRPEKRIRRLRRWATVCLSACLLLLLAVLTLLAMLAHSHAQLLEMQAVQEQSLQELSEIQQELESTRELLNTVEEDLTQRDMVIAAYESATGIAPDSLP